jgi:hypothetical protein
MLKARRMAFNCEAQRMAFNSEAWRQVQVTMVDTSFLEHD